MTNPPPPAELQHLVQRIGAEATLLLIELRGGTRLFIARDPGPTSLLARELGLDAARALAEEFGGDYIKLPLAKYWRAQVYQKRGLTYREIALKLGCTEKTVGVYLQISRRNDPQMALPL